MFCIEEGLGPVVGELIVFVVLWNSAGEGMRPGSLVIWPVCP